MSIQSQITRLTNAKDAIKAAIAGKGVTVPSETKMDGMAALIDDIEVGITPSGNVELEKQSGTDVTSYATASVRSGSVTLNTPSINTSTGVVTASAALSTSGWVGSAPSSTTLSLTTQAAKTVTPSASSQTAVEAQRYTTGAVTVAGDANLAAGNIKDGVTIFGVTGSHAGQKPEQTKTVTPTAAGLTVTPDSGKALSSVVVNGDIDLVSRNIKSGVNIFGVAGTYTSDANAGRLDILQDKTAYVNGQKVTGGAKLATFDMGNEWIKNVADFSFVSDPANDYIGFSRVRVRTCPVPTEFAAIVFFCYYDLQANRGNPAYESVLVLSEENYITVGFLMPDFAINSYNRETTEFTATGWYAYAYTEGVAEVHLSNWTTTPSQGNNFLRNGVFCNQQLYYDNELVFPLAKQSSGKPTLDSPKIGLSGDMLVLDDSYRNGNFASGYDIYANGELIASVAPSIPSNWCLLTYGISTLSGHNVTITYDGTDIVGCFPGCPVPTGETVHVRIDGDGGTDRYAIYENGRPVYGPTVSASVDRDVTITRSGEQHEVNWAIQELSAGYTYCVYI